MDLAITEEVICHCAFRMKCLYCSHLVWKITFLRSCCSTLCKVQEQVEQYYSQLPGFTSLSLCHFLQLHTHSSYIFFFYFAVHLPLSQGNYQFLGRYYNYVSEIPKIHFILVYLTFQTVHVDFLWSLFLQRP